jgi:hypothetical protein
VPDKVVGNQVPLYYISIEDREVKPFREEKSMVTFKSITKKEVLALHEESLALQTLISTLRDNGKFWVIYKGYLTEAVADEVIEDDFVGSPVFETREGDIAQFGLFSDSPTSLAIRSNAGDDTFVFTVGSNTYQILTEKGLLS